MPVQCKTCHQIWPRDPILEVACPTCRAPIGRRCKRPSGHDAGNVHAARDLLAMERVPGYGRCLAAQPKPALAPARRRSRSPRLSTQQLALPL